MTQFVAAKAREQPRCRVGLPKENRLRKESKTMINAIQKERRELQLQIDELLAKGTPLTTSEQTKCNLLLSKAADLRAREATAQRIRIVDRPVEQLGRPGQSARGPGLNRCPRRLGSKGGIAVELVEGNV